MSTHTTHAQSSIDSPGDRATPLAAETPRDVAHRVTMEHYDADPLPDYVVFSEAIDAAADTVEELIEEEY